MVLGGQASPGRLAILVLALTAAVVFAGCTGSQQAAQIASNSGGCVDASGAQNQPRQFQYSGAASCKTATETFDWENPSPYAEVQYGSGVAEGKLAIRILDAADRTVYESSVTGGGEGRQERTQAGMPTVGPGTTWTIELTFENVTGSLGLQVVSAR